VSGQPAALGGVAAAPRVQIRPSRGFPDLQARELWAHRDLLFFLVLRDVKLRYRQTALGAAWAILQPVLTMIVFSVFFGRLAAVPSDSLPYPVFTFVALLPWQLFAHTLAQSANSVVSNSTLVARVYFPRIIIPLAAVAAGLVDFGIAFGVLILMMGYYGIRPTVLVVTLPAFLALAVATALGVGLWLAVLNVRYRDVRYTIPFLTQLWLFLSPVAYPSSIVPAPWSLVYALNPMAGVVEGFRWALLGHTGAPGATLLVSALMVLVLLAGGFVYFRKSEPTFADVV
jgi:lipopolysaccharide transport system permease protein